MDIKNDIAKVAELIGDNTRASILVALMEGRTLTAGELALRANISPQTASNHLKKLLAAKLINHVKTAGRYRYYQIASPLVAQALEALSVLKSPAQKSCPPRHGRLNQEIRFARTCYDHLAGELGVKVTQALVKKNFLQEQDGIYSITIMGKNFFSQHQIDCDTLIKQSRQFARCCLDWTEREYHLAGSLGKALLDYFLQQRLLLRSKTKPRVVLLTTQGQLWLRTQLGLAFLKSDY